jgi:hypothetical protein
VDSEFVSLTNAGQQLFDNQVQFTTYKTSQEESLFRISFLFLQIESQKVLLVTPEQGIVFPAAEYIRDVVFRYCLSTESNVLVVVEGTNVHHIDSTVAKVRKTYLLVSVSCNLDH